MSQHKNKEFSFNRSVNLESARFRKIININPEKKDALSNKKIFLENILGKIKKAQCDYLTKRQLLNNQNEKELIKGILSKLIKDLKKTKKEKEEKIKILKIKKEQKKSNLKDIMINANIHKRRRINSENINLKPLIENESDIYINELLKNDEHDFKIKNFVLENKIIEVENSIERVKFLIKFNKTPHKFKNHFTEILFKDKTNKQNIMDNLHENLIDLRSLWKDVSIKKNLQDMTMESIKARIDMLKKEYEKYDIKGNKYINTEDIIYEEMQETEYAQETTKANGEKKETKNDINLDIKEDDDKKNIKIDLKDLEKLLKLNMNINVNINVNKQYINNHFNNCEPNNFVKDKYKKPNQTINDYKSDTNTD